MLYRCSFIGLLPYFKSQGDIRMYEEKKELRSQNAFPRTVETFGGLSRREFMAATIAQGSVTDKLNGRYQAEEIAKATVEIVDSLMKELDR